MTQRAYLSDATSYDAAMMFRLALWSDPDARTADRAYTPLHLAVKFGHVTVVAALCGGGAAASAAGQGGITPLHIACRRGRTRAAAALLDGRADMEVGSCQQCSRLIIHHIL